MIERISNQNVTLNEKVKKELKEIKKIHNVQPENNARLKHLVCYSIIMSKTLSDEYKIDKNIFSKRRPKAIFYTSLCFEFTDFR